MPALVRWLLALSLLTALTTFPFGCSQQIGSTTPEVRTSQETPLDESTLCEQLDRASDFAFARRHLNTADHAAWQVVHGLLLYGRDFQIKHDGKLVGALDYLLGGGSLKGWRSEERR